jgi:hypothetical protein
MAFLDTSTIPSAEQVNQGHTNSDVDKSRLSQHHTLGTSATQASPGNHNHDGISSVKIKFEDIEGGWMNVDGGMAYENFGGLPIFDGGSA